MPVALAASVAVPFASCAAVPFAASGVVAFADWELAERASCADAAFSS
ncbi:hypothetical protein J4573_02595 [Actinomadura barringtoniae]|uniref:Uncharacterized protein n=1 Tax=Actinomadura barringtoniae TaxID=1427535 RepID=A0A939P6Q4_9ACTN|nr:hypothetical protein [Actinomadura barringtoniae]MBO2445967.1 hypothetical protein [Actinomadura barringtoniae]